MSDERISDDELAIAIIWAENIPSVLKVLRELQQRRAADKYKCTDHLETCSEDINECTCGYDQLPEWLRGGM